MVSGTERSNLGERERQRERGREGGRERQEKRGGGGGGGEEGGSEGKREGRREGGVKFRLLKFIHSLEFRNKIIFNIL